MLASDQSIHVYSDPLVPISRARPWSTTASCVLLCKRIIPTSALLLPFFLLKKTLPLSPCQSQGYPSANSFSVFKTMTNLTNNRELL